MNDLNEVSLCGNLTRDCELKYTSGGMAVGTFALANNRSVKRNGEFVNEVSFYDITVFGKTAENLKQYLTKGKRVIVGGKLKQDRWEKEGQKFSKIGIVADFIQLVGGAEKAEVQTNGERLVKDFANAVDAETVTEEEFSEDIPF